MAENVKDLLAEANAAVPKLSPTEAGEKIRSGNVLIVDVRDPTEVRQSGRLKGAMNVSRGMLEFHADPESQYYDPAFQKDKTILLHCASGGVLPWRAKLSRTWATQTCITSEASRI